MKPIASLSLDLDNQWSYMKTHGDAGWENFPSYLDTVVPRALECLRERGLNITFFIVGQDAALEKNVEALRLIASAGHEIGNHSFNHEPWLHLYSREQLLDEFEKTEHALFDATGARPVGFRGPGYSLSQTVLEVLCERGYEYDCSTLPTYIAPLARAFYFLKSPKMTAEERAKRDRLFGSVSDGFQPIKPYKWHLGGKEITEIPVTTCPGIKTPIHASYFLYIASHSAAAARSYFRNALRACRLMRIEPSILLHPLDFLSADDVPELRFFPAMDMRRDVKLKLLAEYLDTLSESFKVVNMREHARSIQTASIEYGYRTVKQAA
jgi:peptidoglycan-N-acetylglucosamine deacetylase